MSINFSRLIVALVLALTIPLQGLAAVTAGVCMSLGHHDGGAPAQHDHAAGHGHDADHSMPEQDSGGHDSVHCAPCVACCAAASIAPAAQVFVPEDSPAAAVAAVPYLHTGFLPEKLDRPPLVL